MALSPHPHQVLAKIAHIENVVLACRDKVCNLTASHAYLTSRLKGLEEDFGMKLHHMDTQISYMSHSKVLVDSQESVASCEKRLLDKLKQTEEGLDRKVNALSKELVERHAILKKDIEDRVEKIQNELATLCKEVTNDIYQRKAAKDAKLQRRQRKEEKNPNIVTGIHVPSSYYDATSVNSRTGIEFILKGVRRAYQLTISGHKKYSSILFDSKRDQFGYAVQLEVYLNGRRDSWTWSTSMCAVVSFPDNYHNQQLKWPIRRKMTVDVLGGQKEVLSCTMLKTWEFKWPGYKFWLNGVFNLDDLFGENRHFNFNTSYVQNDEMRFHLTLFD